MSSPKTIFALTVLAAVGDDTHHPLLYCLLSSCGPWPRNRSWACFWRQPWKGPENTFSQSASYSLRHEYNMFCQSENSYCSLMIWISLCAVFSMLFSLVWSVQGSGPIRIWQFSKLITVVGLFAYTARKMPLSIKPEWRSEEFLCVHRNARICF